MSDSGETEAQQVAAAATQAVIEVSSFANYLRRVVPVLLEDADDTPESLIAAVKDRTAVESMKKFLSDPQVPVLVVQRSIIKGDLLIFLSMSGSFSFKFIYYYNLQVPEVGPNINNTVVLLVLLLQ